MTPPLPGEYVAVLERLVVAPGAGVFRTRPRRDGHTSEAFVVDYDDELGVLEGPGTLISVRSPFRGQLMGMLAKDGERLREGQPVAWLRLA